MRRSLVDVTERLEAHAVPHILYEGTLLGLVRDGDIIPWDSDVDIAVFEPIPATLLDALTDPVLLQTHVPEYRNSSGCWKVYSKEHYDQLDWMRLFFKRTYIDICFIGSREIDAPIIQNRSRSTLSVWGKKFFVPADVRRALSSMYGDHYMIPNRKDDRGAGFNSFADTCPHVFPKLKYLFLILGVVSLTSVTFGRALWLWALCLFVNGLLCLFLGGFSSYLSLYETSVSFL